MVANLQEYVGSPTLNSFPHSCDGELELTSLWKPTMGSSPHRKYSKGVKIILSHFSSFIAALRFGDE